MNPQDIKRGGGDQPWEAENMIYSPEEYDMYYDLLEKEIEANPDKFGDEDELDDHLEDQEIVDSYNKIKEGAPEITPQQLAALIPKMMEFMASKVGGGEPNDDKLNALNSIQNME